MEKGQEFEKLAETFIIFITENDVLGGSRPIYHIDRYIREEKRLFGDGAHIIYVNRSFQDGTPLGRLMHDFQCRDADQIYNPVLAEKMRFYKENPKGVNEMCKILEDMWDEAIEEGREAGEIKRASESVRRMLEDGILPLKKIAGFTGLLLEDVIKLQSSLSSNSMQGGQTV